MLRYIMRRHWRYKNGAQGRSYYTIDGDAAEVEYHLGRGGHDEDGYEHTELAGVEVIDIEKAKPCGTAPCSNCPYREMLAADKPSTQQNHGP